MGSMQALGADYPITLKTPLGPVNTTLSVPLDQMAKDAINATWPQLQAKINAEVPGLVSRFAPEVQKQLPALLETIKPEVERQRKALVADVKKTALGLALGLGGAVLLGAAWAGRRR